MLPRPGIRHSSRTCLITSWIIPKPMAWKQNLIYSQPTDKTGEDETFLLHLGCHCSACQTKSEGTTLPLSLTPCLPKKIMHCFNGIQSTARIKVIDVMSTVPQNSLFSITAALNSSSIACFFRFICNQYEASLQTRLWREHLPVKVYAWRSLFPPNCGTQLRILPWYSAKNGSAMVGERKEWTKEGFTLSLYGEAI